MFCYQKLQLIKNSHIKIKTNNWTKNIETNMFHQTNDKSSFDVLFGVPHFILVRQNAWNQQMKTCKIQTANKNKEI